MAGASSRLPALRSHESAVRSSDGSSSATRAGAGAGAARALWLTSLALLVTALAACGVNGGQPTGAGGQGGQGGQGGLDGANGETTGTGPRDPCQSGATRECHVLLGQHGSVKSCYDGTQVCVDGTWGTCGDGSVHDVTAPAPAEAKGEPDPGRVDPLSLSDAGPCMNPCDPTCLQYDEKPLGGSAVALTPWTSGSFIGLQNNVSSPTKKGFGYKQPCSSAADCEYNLYCKNPDSGTCGHHKCATGTPLDPSCDSCVQQICAADPTCCVQAPGCLAHDPCLQGAALNPSCGNTCVQQICAADPTCCTSNWGASCVAKVATTCKQTCGSWKQSCVDKVHDVCGAFCNVPPSTPAPACAHDRCYSGGPLNGACDNCVQLICNDPTSAYCCTSAWDKNCVTKVTTSCGRSCPLQGACTPWLPGESDQKCASADLTVGIACSSPSSAPPRLTICNVGTQTAPPGVRVVGYPGGTVFTTAGASANICNPGTPPKDFGVTPDPIPPGGCINVSVDTKANPALSTPASGDEIMVNPPGSSQVAECQCRNNWAVYASPMACEPSSCSGNQPGSESLIPGIYFAVDRSKGLSAAGASGIQGGLKKFFQDNGPRVNGIIPALGFFPDTISASANCDATKCDQSQCQARVPFNTSMMTTLTTAAAPSDTLEGSLVAALNAQTIDTRVAPTGAAVQSALLQARQFPQYIGRTNSTVVLILASEPATCKPSSPPPTSVSTAAEIAGLVGNEYLTYGTKTFVIGIGPNVAKSTIDLIANAGGTQGYYYNASDPSLSTLLYFALLDIRNNIFPCVYPLPGPGQFDPTATDVRYLPGGAAVGTKIASIPKYNDALACGSAIGYYFDNNADPRNIVLCPQTCAAVNTFDPASGVHALPFIKVFLQCSAAVRTQTYVGQCPAGSRVQWGYLGWDTSDPSGTSVVFQGRTADTIAGLASATFVTLGTAQSSPTNTQKCPLGSACTVDLYSKLGGVPNAIRQYLEVSLTLNQNLTAITSPAVNGWKVTYSCPPSE